LKRFYKFNQQSDYITSCYYRILDEADYR